MPLAPYACLPETSLGRVIAEPPSTFRTDYQRDRDRVLHSTAFRRLQHKTQVFISFEGDHYRTRLTHSLEVAQIARTLARALGADEDLAEAVALAHDLGHSPFGHAGEAALDTALAGHGGFDHNLQTFRIVTSLEHRYAGFDGLNLTFETLEGVVKHNGPLHRPLTPEIEAHELARRIDLAEQAPLEAQLAAIADDVAYTNHDLDDGLRAGFFEPDELCRFALTRPTVEQQPAGLEPARRIHETTRRLTDFMARDLILETRQRIAAERVARLEDVRRATRPLVAFSPAVAEGLAELRAFLQQRVYRHYKVNRMSLKARRVVAELFEVLMAAPECLPDGWREQAAGPGSQATAETVRDYIAGMTDRYALDEHDRLFKLSRERA
jgi:dGTPase